MTMNRAMIIAIALTFLLGGSFSPWIGHKLHVWRRNYNGPSWRSRWRLWRAGIAYEDLTRAIDAAWLAGDLVLASHLTFQFRLKRCPCCGTRRIPIVARGTNKAAEVSSPFSRCFYGAVHDTLSPETMASLFTPVDSDDPRYQCAILCRRCWNASTLPTGWNPGIVRWKDLHEETPLERAS